MKKTVFSKGIYVESLRRLRVIGFLALAVLLIVQLAPVIVQLTDYAIYLESKNDYSANLNDAEFYSNISGFSPMSINFQTVLLSAPVLAIFVAPLMIVSVFSVFNKRSSSDFYHALPYTRPCIFFSMLSAVLSWILAICIVCSAVGLICFVSMPHLFTLTFDGAFDLSLTYFAILLMTVGATSLAMAVTGTNLSNICVAGLILFLPRFIITIMTEWISQSASFLAFNYQDTSILSPNINVLFAHFAGSMYYSNGPDFSNNIGADIYSICLGLVYIALALFAFVKRKSETATCPAPSRFAQHIIRIMLSMVVGIFAVILFVEGEYAGFVIVSLVTLTVYFAYELITTRRFKNLVRALPGVGVLAGLCIACVVVIAVVPMIASGYTPNADDIDSVRLVASGVRYDNEWFGAEARDLEIKDKKVLKTVCEALKDNMDNYRSHGSVYGDVKEVGSDHYYGNADNYVTQTVAIRDGLTTKYRNIAFTGEQFSEILMALEEDDEYIEACMTLPKPQNSSIEFNDMSSEVNNAYKKAVFDCLQEEIYGLTFEEWYNITNVHDGYHYETELYYWADDYNTTYVYVPISSEDFPKTFEMIIEADKIRRDEKVKELEYLLTDEEFSASENLWYAGIDAYVKLRDEEGAPVYYYATNSYWPEEDGYVGDWQDQAYVAELAEIFARVKDFENEPTADGYIQVFYNWDQDDTGCYDSIYLPLPEDFDPEAYGFKLINSEDYWE